MPTLDALDDAMLRPGRSVPAVNRLGGGTIAMAGSDQPWRVVGSSSVVYQLRQPSGRVLALRCPRDGPADLDAHLAERYRALGVDPALNPLRGTPTSPLLDQVSFVTDGLLFPAPDFRSIGHPVMVLEWVMGPTLLAAVDRACRADDRSTLAALAERWRLAVGQLAAAGFSHGDLSSDNALVRPGGGIAFVDYDTAVWNGSPPARGATIRANYSHPTGILHRDPGRRDDFPALLIYVSLRVLALWPALRAEIAPQPVRHGGPLVFADPDLDNPDTSALFARLRVLDDPAIRYLLAALRQACLSAVEQTPSLAAAVAGAATAARAAAPAVTTRGRPAQPLRRAADEARAPSNWPTSQGWPSAPPNRRPPIEDGTTGVAPVRRPSDQRDARPSRPPPSAARVETPLSSHARPGLDRERSPLTPIDSARDRQSRMTRLNSLLLAGDDDAADEYWEASGLKDDPESARELGPRMDELDRRRALRRARGAAEAGDSATLLQLWESERFGDYRPAAPLQPMVDAARRRVQTVRRLETALDSGDVASVARLWPELRGDPLASGLALRANAVMAEHLGGGVAGALASGGDEAIVAAVRDAESAGIAVEVAARRAARAAATRVETRRELMTALAENDRETLAALALSGRLEELGPLQPAQARKVLQALAWPPLERALAADDDATILATFDPQLFDDAALTERQRRRIDLARERTQWLEEVRGALRQRDMVALWRAVQAVPPGAEQRLSRVERTRIERLAAREEAVAALATALRDGPDTAILDALAQVEAAGAAIPDSVDWSTVRGVVDRVTLAEAIHEATQGDTPDYGRVARLLAAAQAAAIDLTSDDRAVAADALDLAHLETEMLRAAHVARLREAIAAGDAFAIAAAADPDPYGAVASLSPIQRDAVQRALSRRSRHGPRAD